jgi:dimethylargininase
MTIKWLRNLIKKDLNTGNKRDFHKLKIYRVKNNLRIIHSLGGRHMYKNTIIKTPIETFVFGLTTTNQDTSIYEKSLEQHSAYLDVLQKCGVELDLISTILNLPDCTFVGNKAVLTPTFAVISNPGMLSGIDEVFEMESILKTYHNTIYYIQAPGTLECEDVLQIENHFYIGVSAKTNQVGAQQLKQILEFEDYEADIVPHSELSHLKNVLLS